MNWKGPGRKRPWTNRRYYSGIEVTTQNNHEKSGTGRGTERNGQLRTIKVLTV